MMIKKKITKSGYLLLLIATHISHAQKINFKSHELSSNGYLKTGFGWTNGCQMVNYITPDNMHKFKMGNDASHYVELQFNYRYKNKKSVDLYEVTYMMTKYIPFGSNDYKQFPETSQLYGKVNKVVNNANVWVGKRYYDRREAEILDYYWINAVQEAQLGIGLENYQIKNFGNMNLALIRFKYGNHDAYSYVTDYRYLDIPVSKHSKVSFLGQYSIKTSNDVANTPRSTGYALGGWWTYSKKYVTNISTILFRQGSSITSSPYSGKTVEESLEDIVKYDLHRANTFDIINDFVYDDKRRHTIQTAFNYHYRDFGIGNVDKNGEIIDNKVANNFFCVGIRYLYHINKHFNLALEAGNDYMNNNRSGIEGSLQKVTFFPQISWNYKNYSRQLLIPFVTYAHWSDKFKGITGVSDFNTKLINKNNGFSFGLQLKIWW